MYNTEMYREMRQTQTRYANVQHRNVQRNVRQDGIWKKEESNNKTKPKKLLV